MIGFRNSAFTFIKQIDYVIFYAISYVFGRNFFNNLKV